MTPEDRQKQWEDEINAANAKDDANWGFSFGSVFKWVGIILVIAVIYTACTSVTDDKASNVATSKPSTGTTPMTATNVSPQPTTNYSRIFNQKEDVTAGSLVFNVSEVSSGKTLGSAKTENLFIILKVKITSNDTKPRDISTSLFKLQDSQNRTFEAYDNYYGNDSLIYETINPGLTVTKTILFEIPSTLKGNVSLLANSGVALAGGVTVKINLLTLQ